MHEVKITTRFEADLAAALGAYTDAAPIAVDPTVVARTAIARHPRRRHAPVVTWRALRPALLLAALLALLVAMLLASGAVPLPSPVQPARSRLLVADQITAWVVGPERTVTAAGRPNLPRSNGCWLIGGTDTVMSNNYFTWAFASLSLEPLPLVTASAGYGGGQRWSPDRVKVALVAASEGRITVLDFTDPSAVVTTTWDLPGMIGAGWLPDSDGMVVARRASVGVVEVTVRGLDGSVGQPQQVDIGPFSSSDDFELIEPIVSPDGRSVVLSGVQSEIAVLDDVPLPVLADDGRLRILGPTAYPLPSWSPGSDRVAWVNDRRLSVVDDHGARHLELPDGAGGPIAWLSADRLLVPGIDHAWLVDPVALKVAGTIEDPGASGLWSVDRGLVVRAALADGVVRVRWYRPDGTPDGPDLALTDPDGTAVDAPSCLDVQPVTD